MFLIRRYCSTGGLHASVPSMDHFGISMQQKQVYNCEANNMCVLYN